MKPGGKAVEDIDLHAYVDGELDDQRRLEVEAWVAENAGAAQQVKRYQQLNHELHSLFDPVLNEVPPAPLLAGIGECRSGNKLNSFKQAAVITGLMFVSALAGWTAHSLPVAGIPPVAMIDLVEPAAFAHTVYTTDNRYPVEFDAGNRQQLSDWVSERMHTQLQPPLLDGTGFKLVGGRLLPSTNRMAAQFMYENARGERVTLYIRRGVWNNHETSSGFAEEKGVSVYYWINGEMGYAVSANLDRQELAGLVQAVHRSLDAVSL